MEGGGRETRGTHREGGGGERRGHIERHRYTERERNYAWCRKRLVICAGDDLEHKTSSMRQNVDHRDCS